MFWRIGVSLDSIQKMTGETLPRPTWEVILETTDNYLVHENDVSSPDENGNREDRYHVKAGAKTSFHPCAKHRDWYDNKSDALVVKKKFYDGKSSRISKFI